MKSNISFIMPVAIIFAIAMLANTPIAIAQPCQLSLNVSYTPVEQLTLSDIDFEHFESRNLLFTAVITNTGLPTTARIHGKFDIKLANGTYNGTAITFTTEPFMVSAEGRMVTNTNIGNNADIKMQDFDLTDEAKDKVQSIALSTGKFPAGIYILNIELEQIACGIVGDKDIEFDLKNPSRIELRSPRDGEVTNEFPLFEFFSDGDPAVLTVAEMAPGQSREDAMTRKPPMLEVELNGQNSFLYAGGRPLEQGKSYVWSVKTSTLGTGGSSSEVTSPVGLFTVSSSPAGADESTENAIISQLEELFGQRYPSIFQSIRNGNLTLTGNFSLNQSPLTEAQLLDLINQLREIGDSVDLSLE